MGSIASSKAAVGFTEPQARAGCANCQHGQASMVEDTRGQQRQRWHCKSYGFAVHPYAWCEHYVRMAPAAVGEKTSEAPETKA